MCGFAGYLGGEWQDGSAAAQANLRHMNGAIRARGPDSDGYWTDSAAGIALGHRRLAILDLSAAGAQPMHSACGRFVVAYNGEIYNHLDLREELAATGDAAAAYRGHSDTETLLTGISRWGIRATLDRCVGMFAFALWDRESRTLTLARDRAGEKPLYYGWQGDGRSRTLLFGSELKALRAHPSFVADIDRDALCLLMRHNYVPAPHSIYRGVKKLPAGCMLTLGMDRGDAEPERYWSLASVATEGVAEKRVLSEAGQLDELESQLRLAVRQQMVADVPLGAFLSGGVDSSLIVSLMQAQSDRPVRTFTIGYHESAYNEAVHAAQVAAHLGTEHTELYVQPAQALEVIPELAQVYCEPFSDSSQVPTLLVARLARQHVKVALTGDAGDELFGGYNRYVMTQRMWRRLAYLPASARRLLAGALTRLSPATLDRVAGGVQRLLPARWHQANIGDKLHKGAAVLGCESIDELYLRLVSHWQDPTDVVIGGREPPTQLTGMRPSLAGLGAIEQMMALDSLTYLPDDNLVKVDRAAMSVSLECRVPLLDHRLIELAWRMPFDLKLRAGVGKWALRQVLYKYVPRALIERPKMGFAVPIADWLRGPLREWAEALLDETRLRREGYFDPVPVRRRWHEHLHGSRNWQYHLWDVLMFQSWLESNADR